MSRPYPIMPAAQAAAGSAKVALEHVNALVCVLQEEARQGEEYAAASEKFQLPLLSMRGSDAATVNKEMEAIALRLRSLREARRALLMRLRDLLPALRGARGTDVAALPSPGQVAEAVRPRNPDEAQLLLAARDAALAAARAATRAGHKNAALVSSFLVNASTFLSLAGFKRPMTYGAGGTIADRKSAPSRLECRF
ncbi:MAG: hypothetical protein HYV63_05315 [Candidatus Schekmanbacteria bacterium]|nr:hypothetical protein [Candidatus Schekmanbacteria bacterium]